MRHHFKIPALTAGMTVDPGSGSGTGMTADPGSGSRTGMTICHQLFISAAARYAHHTHIVPLPLQVLTQAADNSPGGSIGEPVSEFFAGRV